MPGEEGSTSQIAGTVVALADGTFAVTGDYDYLQPGTNPVTVAIDGPDGTLTLDTTATVAPTGHVGGRVWDDADGDGVQGEEEPGQANVTVTSAATPVRRPPPTRTGTTSLRTWRWGRTTSLWHLWGRS